MRFWRYDIADTGLTLCRLYHDINGIILPYYVSGIRAEYYLYLILLPKTYYNMAFDKD